MLWVLIRNAQFLAEEDAQILVTVNVLKFRTLYSLPFLSPYPFCSLCSCFLRCLVKKANSVDPDQTAPSGAV